MSLGPTHFRFLWEPLPLCFMLSLICGERAMLTCKNLRFKRGDFSLEITLDLKVGERVALMAPSGEGKSTLIEGLTGLLEAQSGALLSGAQDITQVAPHKRPLAILFQDGNLFDHLSSLENCTLVGAGKDEALSLLEKVGLGEIAQRPAAQLSGGQRQRASLVRALLQKKPYLILDEPFSALDSDSRALCYALLKERNAIGILFATHDPRDVEALATRTLILRDGRIAPSPKT
ncbi:MAG: thiamine ABC transporter ATP-binding protein [Candidatus Puniceispirillum sp.]|nr:thiamine ABC transporter ATP-binding protein [Candidatus Puniceispirillum sp.]